MSFFPTLVVSFSISKHIMNLYSRHYKSVKTCYILLHYYKYSWLFSAIQLFGSKAFNVFFYFCLFFCLCFLFYDCRIRIALRLRPISLTIPSSLQWAALSHHPVGLLGSAWIRSPFLLEQWKWIGGILGLGPLVYSLSGIIVLYCLISSPITESCTFWALVCSVRHNTKSCHLSTRQYLQGTIEISSKMIFLLLNVIFLNFIMLLPCLKFSVIPNCHKLLPK